MSDRFPAEHLDPDYDDGTMPDNVEDLASRVVGHRIASVERGDFVARHGQYGRDVHHETAITLDDGTRVLLANTSDCCAYTELENFLLNADLIDHVILGVGTTGEYTKWHIYADAGDVLSLDVSWSSGNPFYYGYGFHIAVVDEGRP